MKPINEWTLQGCLKSLRRMDSDLYEYGLHIELADRIHELTRWIPIEERFPDENDAKGAECIVWSKDGNYWRRIEKPEGV